MIYYTKKARWNRWCEWWDQRALAFSVCGVMLGAITFSALPIFY